MRTILLVTATLLLVPSDLSAQNAPTDWAAGAVWYQVYIDRFENGDVTNDPFLHPALPSMTEWRITPWGADWYATSDAEREFDPDPDKSVGLRGYGGDLQGLINRLDYLSDLGVEVLLLTPIFDAGSFHRFDAASFHHVDPSLGPNPSLSRKMVERENPVDTSTWAETPADTLFLALVRECHRRGLRVVLESVFHHVGSGFWAYRDLLRRQRESPYAGWFEVTAWDDPSTEEKNETRCEGMWDSPLLPLFRSDSLGYALGVRNYLFLVTRRWMDPDGDGDCSDGIDGWRLQYADAMPEKFLREWVRYTKRINPRSIVVGDRTRELSPDTPMDAMVNYRFRKEVLRFFGEGAPGDASGFDGALQRTLDPTQPDLTINILDMYDTGRISADIRQDGKNRLRGPDDPLRARRMIAALFQFTYPGSPLILYGDEAGIWGPYRSDCLKPMLWPGRDYAREFPGRRFDDTTSYTNRFDSTLHHFYRRLIELRKGHLSLRSGSFITILLDDARGIYGFKRKSGSDEVYILFNTGGYAQEVRISIPGIREGTRIDDPVNGVHFYARGGGLEFAVPPGKGVILVPAL